MTAPAAPRAWTFATAKLRCDRSRLLCALALGVAVAVAAYVCVIFPRALGRIAPIWIANGLVVAALMRTPRQRWPLLVAAAVLGNTAANRLAGDPLSIGFALSACNALEAVLCAGVLRQRVGEGFDISRPRHLGWFGAAAAGAALISAIIASAFLDVFDKGRFLQGIVFWVQADVLGLLTVTPCLLAFTLKPRPVFHWRESWTLALLAVVTFAVLFVSPYPMLFLIGAMLFLPTWRMGLAGALAGFAIVAAIGAAAGVTQHGPFIFLSGGRVMGLQLFLCLCFMVSVPLASARDRSERMKSQLRAALRQARAARHRAEQAATVKTEFLANMSHELRTPLTSVIGFTRLAQEQPDLSPLSRDYIDRVGVASRALLCAVNDILDFSKLEAGQVVVRPEPAAFAPIARGALDLFMPQAAAKDIALRLEDSTPAALVIAVDADRLRQVLLNLVGNAVKFTAAGEVVVRASYDEASQQLAVEVADTGPGVPPDRMDRLFKRFSQVDGSLTRGHGGTGLGLAICKGVVEAMGGEIWAESQLGHGSLFSFHLPAARCAAAQAQPVLEDPVETCGALRVLVADDHAANRDLARLFMAAVGAEVLEASDGAEAVAEALRQPFDVILMDLRMPGLDGAGAMARIRAGDGPNRETPILAFTADAECVFDGRLKLLGFDGAVAKPLEPRALIAAIAAVTQAPHVEPVALGQDAMRRNAL